MDLFSSVDQVSDYESFSIGWINRPHSSSTYELSVQKIAYSMKMRIAQARIVPNVGLNKAFGQGVQVVISND